MVHLLNVFEVIGYFNDELANVILIYIIRIVVHNHLNNRFMIKGGWPSNYLTIKIIITKFKCKVN